MSRDAPSQRCPARWACPCPRQQTPAARREYSTPSGTSAGRRKVRSFFTKSKLWIVNSIQFSSIEFENTLMSMLLSASPTYTLLATPRRLWFHHTRNFTAGHFARKAQLVVLFDFYRGNLWNKQTWSSIPQYWWHIYGTLKKYILVSGMCRFCVLGETRGRCQKFTNSRICAECVRTISCQCADCNHRSAAACQALRLFNTARNLKRKFSTTSLQSFFQFFVISKNLRF